MPYTDQIANATPHVHKISHLQSNISAMEYKE